MSDNCMTCHRQAHNARSIESEIRIQVRKLNNTKLTLPKIQEIKARIVELKATLQSNRDRLTQHQKGHA